MFFRHNLNLEFLLSFFIKAFLFLLPWQTVYIFREVYLSGIKIEPLTLGFYATEMLLWVIIILFIVWYLRKYKVESRKYKGFCWTSDRVFLLSCLLFTFYSLLSTVWAVDKDLALQQALHIIEAFLLFFILFIGPFKFGELALWFVSGALLSGLLGIYQFITQTTFASKWLGLSAHPVWQSGTSVLQNDVIGRWLRAYGTFEHPNILGGYLVTAFLVCSFFCIAGFCAQKKYQAIQYLFLSILLISVFLSFSRSAVLAICFLLFIVLVYSFYQHKGIYSSKIFYFLSLLLVVVSLIFFQFIGSRFFVNSAVLESISVSERLSGVRQSMEIINHNKWLGVGAGNYTNALIAVAPGLSDSLYQPVHNVFLLMVAELGILGFVFFAIICGLWSYLFREVLYCKLGSDLVLRNYKWIFNVVLLIFFWLILAFFDHYLYSSYIGLMLAGVYWGLMTKFFIGIFHR